MRLCSPPRACVHLLLLTCTCPCRRAFYKKLQWQSLLAKKIEAPFKPKIATPLDTSNFDHLDAPDEGVPVNTKLPKGLFDEFTALKNA